MNYIYDILLNFNKDYYNFFEWKKNDNYINIKKIPLFLVGKDTFNSIKYNWVTVSKDFASLIKDKTFTYSRTNNSLTACLICNGKEVIGIVVDDNGLVTKRSSLLLDEEEEVLDEIADCSLFEIEIVKEKKVVYENINRMEKEKKNYLLKYINKEKCDINLKYLYYDYFEKDEDDISIIKNDLIYEIKNNWNSKFNNLYDLVKIFNRIKN